MEDFHSNNTLQNNSHYDNEFFIVLPVYLYILYLIIIIIGLPLSILAIYSLYSQARHDHIVPINIINLLISDLIQLCCMIARMAICNTHLSSWYTAVIYWISVMVSVGFMVCVSLERYFVIAWPLWYHFRRTIKVSVVVCVVVWVLPLVIHVFNILILNPFVSQVISCVFLLLPFPVFIFCVAGTFKALSAAVSVSSEEKRRIVGALILVLLNYTLLFLPSTILTITLLTQNDGHITKIMLVSQSFMSFSPLVNLVLHVFMRKGAVDKLLASLSCCRMDTQQE